MFGKLFLSSVIALSVATPALADWQFTKWGMTQEELSTASPINVKNSQFDPECPSTAPLSSNYEVSKFLKFTACYGFNQDNDTLNYVYLYLRDYASSSILYDAMVDKYGQPKIGVISEANNYTSYKWRSNNNLIILSNYLGDYSNPKMYIYYKPLQPELEVESKL